MIGQNSRDSDRWRSIERDVLPPFALSPSHVRYLGSAGGLSGVEFWQLRASERVWCLRNWRSGKTAARLAMIHGWLRRAVHSGCAFVPLPRATSQGTTWIERRHELWEITPWMPGRPDFASNPTPERLRSVVDHVAQLHLAWQTDVHAKRVACYDVTELVRRLRSAWNRLSVFPQSDGPVHDDELSARMCWIRELASPIAGQIINRVATVDSLNVPMQPIHGDLWHDHLLLQGDHLTGIIDYGAARVGPRVADIARLLGSLCGTDPTRWSQAVTLYRHQVDLSEPELQLLDLIRVSEPLLSASNWAKWIEEDRIQFESRETVLARLDSITQRLQLQLQEFLAND